jgi:hypothetical protein
MDSTDEKMRRFAVALSFPGEHRRFVRNVALRLAEELSRERVFFDEWYEAEIRGSDADLKLKRVYRDDAELVIPFFSEHYTKMWCQIEWKAIRTVLAERRKDDAVLPVHIDGTRIEGWETVDLGIRKGRKTGRQVAEAILEVYQRRQSVDSPEVSGEVIPYEVIHASAKPHPLRPLLRVVERSYANGELQDSSIAPTVISTLSRESDVELGQPFDPDWLVRGIQLSDEYFVRVHGSAGQRDWQRDFPQTATPILVCIARSIEQSADAHALVIQLCDAVAARLRIRLLWPEDPDEYNDLTNCIYAACLQATHLEDDDVLIALKGLKVIGPN